MKYLQENCNYDIEIVHSNFWVSKILEFDEANELSDRKKISIPRIYQHWFE